MVKLLLHINPVELIEKVKLRPAIWNRKDKNHKNAVILSKLWMEIASEMNEPEQHVKTRWKNLRDQYTKELRRLTENVFSNKNKKKPVWRYFNYMNFLRDQVSATNPSRRAAKRQNLQEKPTTWNDDVDDDEDDNDEEDDNDSFLNCSKASTHDDIEREPNPIEVKMEQEVWSESSQAATETLYEGDDDKAFFISLLPHIRKISTAQKLQCQIEIQNIIHKHLCESNAG